MKNYYEILEVNPKASEEIIKKIYKIKVKQNHPDLFQGEEKIKAEEKTKELTEAYSVLSDNLKRKDYDLELEQEISDNSQILRYENLINNLKSENEYLKQIIISRDNAINSFLNEDIEPNEYSSNIYHNNKHYNGKKSTQSSPRSYFFDTLSDLKQLVIRFGVFFILIISFLILFLLISGKPISSILKNMF